MTLYFFRHWPANELAHMLVGAQAEGVSITASAPDLFACLQSAVLDDQITRAAVLQVSHSFVLTKSNSINCDSH